LTDAQVRAIRALQFDLPAQGDPFAPVAQAAKMNVDELLAHGAAFLSRGQMRRYAAVLHHRAAGAEANVLVAWNVPPPQADSAAARCAAFAAVSHCYLRPPAPDWPYNLYTMIHGRSRADCERTISEIVAASDLRDRAELWTTAEYKKQRVPLFGDEEKKWEHQTTT
jgi:DNA-binding Lrp family transcriptional regulator